MSLMTLAQARENFLAAMDTLRSSKVRSALTVLGIVIGVSSVISMAAIIQGLNKFVQDRVESLGSRTYFLTRFPPGTDPAHMPSAHRRYAEWTPDRFHRWARTIGPNTEALITAILANRPHPEQGFRTCLGVLRLYRGIAPARAEAVSARALEINAMTYKSVASILNNNLDRVANRQNQAEPTLFDHPNVRGPRYFN